jgi:hypothetical protein
VNDATLDENRLSRADVDILAIDAKVVMPASP